MSDSSIAIVPKISNFPNNKIKATEILNWLVSKDIVKATPSDCTYGSENGYEISGGARSVTDSSEMATIEFDQQGKEIETHLSNYIPTDLEINGLDIITKRTVFYSGEGWVERIQCPKCNTDMELDEFDFNKWESKENDFYKCLKCHQESEINEFQFHPEWGFSDLGFIFWNWPPFKQEFLVEFSEKLNCEIRIIDQRL